MSTTVYTYNGQVLVDVSDSKWLAEPSVPPRTDGYYLKVVATGGMGCIYNLSPNATALESHIYNNNTGDYLTLEQVNSSSQPSGVYVFEANIPTYAYLGSNATNVTFKYTASMYQTEVTYSLIHSVNGVETVCMSQTVSSSMFNETMTLYYNAHNIIYSTVSNGTVSGPAMSGTGATVTVTATPNANYQLSYITVDGTAIQGNTFTMPDHDVTIGAVFAEYVGSKYRLKLTNYGFTIANLDPDATSGYWQDPYSTTNYTSEQIAAANGSSGLQEGHLYSSDTSASFIFEHVTSNVLTFKYKGSQGNPYVLYKTVNGVETQVATGNLQYAYDLTDRSISLP